MKKSFTLFFFQGLLLMFPLFSLSAQVTLELDQYIVEPGDEIEVPVKVTGFNGIVGMQFQLEWNETVLEYQGTGSYNLPGLGPSNFGPMNPVDSLKVAWFTLSGPVTLPPDATLFTVNFLVTGQHQDTSGINFSDSFPIEVIDNNQPLTVTVVPGFVSVDDPNDISEMQVPSVSLGQNQPNPFTTNTVIPFQLEETSNVHLRIFDQYGRLVWEREGRFLPGSHQLTLNGSELPASGIYHYSLQTGQMNLSKGLIFIQ